MSSQKTTSREHPIFLKRSCEPEGEENTRERVLANDQNNPEVRLQRSSLYPRLVSFENRQANFCCGFPEPHGSVSQSGLASYRRRRPLRLPSGHPQTPPQIPPDRQPRRKLTDDQHRPPQTRFMYSSGTRQRGSRSWRVSFSFYCAQMRRYMVSLGSRLPHLPNKPFPTFHPPP